MVALSLLILLVLRRPLPPASFAVEGRDSDAASEAPTEDASVRSGAALGRQSLGRKSTTPNKYDALFRASMAVAAAQHMDDDGSTSGGETPRSRGQGDDTAHGPPSAASSKLASSKLEEAEAGAAGGAAGQAAAAPKGNWLKRFFSNYGAFLLGVAITQCGMIAFNIGAPDGNSSCGGVLCLGAAPSFPTEPAPTLAAAPPPSPATQG